MNNDREPHRGAPPSKRKAYSPLTMQNYGRNGNPSRNHAGDPRHVTPSNHPRSEPQQFQGQQPSQQFGLQMSQPIGSGQTQAMLTILQNMAASQAQPQNGATHKTVGLPSGPHLATQPRGSGSLPRVPPRPANGGPPPATSKQRGGVEQVNVGGKVFTVGLSTLLTDQQSLLGHVFAALPARARRDDALSATLPQGVELDDARNVFFDRSPTHFHHILTYLREERTPRDECALDVYYEAKFYRVQGLLDWCSRQAGVVSMLVDKQLHELMEEEFEQFKQAILQASHQHVTESLKQDLTDKRATIITETSHVVPGGVVIARQPSAGAAQDVRCMQTSLLVVLAPFQHANACQKRPNAVPVPPPILAPTNGGTPAPPRFESARFVVGNPQLAAHRFISNAASTTAARYPVDIALPYLSGKKLDLLYCLVSQHFAAANMKLVLRQGADASPLTLGSGPGTGLAAQASGANQVMEIPCFECGQPFPLYELVVTWWNV